MMQQVLYDFFSFSKSRISFFLLVLSASVQPKRRTKSLLSLSLSLSLLSLLSLSVSLSLFQIRPASSSQQVWRFPIGFVLPVFFQNTTPSFAISAWYSLTESLSKENFHWPDINVWVSDSLRSVRTCDMLCSIKRRTSNIDRALRPITPTNDRLPCTESRRLILFERNVGE